ncbi:MAG: hypothetical protein E7Z87_02215 [Cyanobacteria bacterium SIG26]|nr:hypothetical protein [Cyanobacteria bacterium SIG26]
MKTKFLNRFIFAILVVHLCTTNFAFAAVDFSPEIKSALVKFTLVMCVIVVFSLILSVGLSVYNKVFVKTKSLLFDNNSLSLKTPEDKDEAVMTYITRNRLE